LGEYILVMSCAPSGTLEDKIELRKGRLEGIIDRDIAPTVRSAGAMVEANEKGVT
jgi:hypothetical protein